MADKRKRKRYIKRLECSFTGAGKTHKGFVSDISDEGLFIRTKRSFAEDSHIDIELYLPDNSVSKVSGVVRRALTTQEGHLAKNGMGVELTDRDANFMRLLKELSGEEERKKLKNKIPTQPREPEKKAPEKVVVTCPSCGAKNAVPADKMSLGPKCGACKEPLAPKKEPEPAQAKAQVEHVIIGCPGCGAKNKLPANKLSLGPKCGACREPLPTG